MGQHKHRKQPGAPRPMKLREFTVALPVEVMDIGLDLWTAFKNSHPDRRTVSFQEWASQTMAGAWHGIVQNIIDAQVVRDKAELAALSEKPVKPADMGCADEWHACLSVPGIRCGTCGGKWKLTDLPPGTPSNLPMGEPA